MYRTAGPGPRPSAGQRQVTPRQAYEGARGGLLGVTNRRRYTAAHMLTAELLAGIGIVAIRAVADYEPQANGTLKGRVGHPKGQYGPLPVLAGLVLTFFLLSFFAASGGTKGKVAVIFGGAVVLTLALSSATEINTVAATFTKFGKAHVPPGHWETSGSQAGSPFANPGSGGGGNGQVVKPVNGRCPPGHGLDPSTGLCIPVIQPGPPAT